MRRLLLALLALVVGCQGQESAAPVPTPSATATPTPTLTPTPAPSPPPATAARVQPRPTARPSPSSPRPEPRRTSAAVTLCRGVPDVGSATQVVLVVSYGSTATVRGCRRDGSRWVSVLGTLRGHVGYNGVAPPGAKREGDGRTPGGVFRLGFGFGIDPDPGLRQTWRRVGPEDVWVDDPGSSLYNTWQELPANGRWQSAESLYTRRSYALAQHVEHNMARVPGRGSAIFLHVDHASPTSGCVSLPRTQLVRVLRWERPGAVMVIR